MTIHLLFSRMILNHRWLSQQVLVLKSKMRITVLVYLNNVLYLLPFTAETIAISTGVKIAKNRRDQFNNVVIYFKSVFQATQDNIKKIRFKGIYYFSNFYDKNNKDFINLMKKDILLLVNSEQKTIII